MQRLGGYAAIFLSALFFYLSTFYLKKGMQQELVSPLLYVHARFLLGFIIFGPIFWLYRSQIIVVNHKQLFVRAFSNSIAVLFFFLGVSLGSVTNSNLLNMTYPAFVAIMAPFFIGEAMRFKDIVVVFLTLVGAFAIGYGDLQTFLLGDLWGLASGVVAGWAIVSLKILRRTDHTYTILAFVFGFGSIFFVPVYFFISLPAKSMTFGFVLLTALTGVLGQLFLTYGYRFVTAVEGSIVSSSRILIALAAGVVFLNDTIDSYIVLGAMLLFFAHIFNAVPKK